MTRYFSTLILSVMLILNAYDIDKLIDTVDPDKTYDNSNALNVYTEVSFDVNDDNSYTKHVFYIKKILNYSGNKRYSDVEIGYNPEYETLELIQHFSVTPDRERIDIPENQIYDLNTQHAAWSPDYIKNRKKVVSFPQINDGYFIVLEYKISNKRMLPVSGVIHFQESNPYLIKKLNIKYPEEMKLRYYSDPGLKMTRSDEEKIKITWEMTDIPIIVDEPSSPSYLYSGKPVIFSFYENWGEYSEKEFSRFNDYEITDKVRELAEKITEDAETGDDKMYAGSDEDKIYAIYKYIGENFDRKYAYLDQMSLKPDPFDKIIDNKYGTSRDLTALFIALNRSLGIEGFEPALTLESSFGDIINKVCDLAVRDVIQGTAAYRDGEIYSIGSNTTLFGYAGYDMHILLQNSKRPQYYSYKDVIDSDIELDMEVKGNDLLVDASMVCNARTDAMMRYYRNYQGEQRTKNFFRRVINDNSAELTEGPVFDSFDDLKNPLKIDFRLKIKDAVIDQDGVKYFNIFYDLRDRLENVSLSKRKNDLDTGSRDKIRFTYRIKAPESNFLNLENINAEFENGDKKARINGSSSRDGEFIVYTLEYFMPKMIVPKEEYPQFREFVMKMKHPLNYMVFLKNIKTDK